MWRRDTCASCGTVHAGRTLKCCTACMMAFRRDERAGFPCYCSAACRKDHFDGGHAEICSKAPKGDDEEEQEQVEQEQEQVEQEEEDDGMSGRQTDA